ncbi:MAG: hypothetical protein IT328_06930 [Caldilineaceae bacterium]|nr:hypothetical protein [Caldilineaceae bacterium]
MSGSGIGERGEHFLAWSTLLSVSMQFVLPRQLRCRRERLVTPFRLGLQFRTSIRTSAQRPYLEKAVCIIRFTRVYDTLHHAPWARGDGWAWG